MDTKRVFHYFYEISKIPRGSGNEKQISDYLLNFAKTNGLYCYQDEYNNILIRKPATKGYEGYKSICLQGHMDMVCEKNSDKEFDFTKDPIEVIEKDGYIMANGTTLGADNGICVAITMAILESKSISHPKLEILLTTDEEMGMIGAKGFDISKLESDILVNIDSEEYGSIYVSSAGSILTENFLEFDSKSSNEKGYTLSISGLKGGHSGVDIHNNTANANIILSKLLNDIHNIYGINISEMSGGKKNNTIPREASSKFTCDVSYEKIKKILDFSIASISHKLKDVEDNICISLNEVENDGINVLSKEDSKKLIEYILGLPNGVMKMSKLKKDLTETSLNMGILELKDAKLRVNNSIRSLVKEEQEYVSKLIEIYTKNYGGKTITTKSYDPWEYKEESKVRDYFAKVFYEQTGEKPRILAMHAGLETGLFAEKNPSMDIISIGPDIKNPHTPDEKMSIEAVSKTYEYLLKILEGYKID